jgi:hypothetical protein
MGITGVEGKVTYTVHTIKHYFTAATRCISRSSSLCPERLLFTLRVYLPSTNKLLTWGEGRVWSRVLYEMERTIYIAIVFIKFV